VTEELAQRFVLLPCGEQVSPADVQTVVDLLALMHAHPAEIARSLPS
jgi:hypothetical protein